MEEPISFWGYKEQESNLILPEHDDDDDDIHSSNTYVRPDDGLRGPKHVACGYFVKGCRCVGRMYIFYDK